MRSALVLGGILGVLAWGPGARAQQTPAAPQRTQRTITVPEADVRSGPSTSSSYYATTKLHRNDTVIVVGQDPRNAEWLAIEPPPGSFSWIDARYVDRKGSNYAFVKDGENPPVLIGSSLVNQKPTVQAAAKLKPGTTLVVIGEPMKDGGNTYLPIQPAPQEVRYIPASAVQGSLSVPLPADGAGAGPAAAAAATGAALTIQQADAAYRARDFASAKRLYEQAVQASSDYSQKAYCFNQLDAITKMPAQQWNNVQSTAKTTSLSPAGPPPGDPLAKLSPGWQWSTWGSLRKAPFQKDGRPVYSLDDSKGQVLMYATAPPGMTLDPYVGRMMTLYGNVSYWNESATRAYGMTVSQVALLPPR
jgi:hypothetical protein